MKVLIIVICISCLFSCARGPESPYGFSLPEGNSKHGEQVFLTYNCLACHSLKGYESENVKTEITRRVALGGDSKKVTTYAELLTSVINPSHKLAEGYSLEEISDENGKSKMWNYNDIMKVSELIDLVAFLQPHYTIKPFTQTEYTIYYP